MVFEIPDRVGVFESPAISWEYNYKRDLDEES
eukprot:CAMPEP_0201285744 /NCGR_PEP_ID=MMETSP1317-20130820/113760_1 /ASSEMBLY_ACC=CAM_ASM_000770 /TAXON_ID=187299 /ORGANISM="Undescribed Undescribed, Strain Undescribed" /LENGTH=31 /DNA_ID= /DNA_START= /DNA_END= /DNA_ORIENTATION=